MGYRQLWVHPLWKEYREFVLARDGHRCTRCQRDSHEVVLQVHHEVDYIPGRLPWEYATDDCVTLCKGCHGREHGKVRPDTGWILSSFQDLGEEVGDCDLCKKTSHYRYQYTIYHPGWGYMDVGSTCVLTLTEESSAYLDKLRKRSALQKRFFDKSKWKQDGDRYHRKFKGHRYTVFRNPSKFHEGYYYRLQVDRESVPKNFNNAKAAILFGFGVAFELELKS